MDPDPKPVTVPPPGATAAVPVRTKGIRIFSYPKVIYLFPTLIVAVICWIGMSLIHDETVNPTKPTPSVKAAKAASSEPAAAEPVQQKHTQFTTPQNLLAVLFLGVFGFNLLVMAIDFPRFTIVAGILLGLFAVFFILWIGAYFDVDLMRWVRNLMASIYAVANSEFYGLTSLMLVGIFAVIYATRYLDYWEILPNEILHHHGPLSDLERYPTTNLKFDKEIPDVLEHLLLGSGRLVLHVAEERKAIVLENVLFINVVEQSLKGLMSRMEVRLTTDQEVGQA
jgi:hypothetical protein